MSFKKNFNKKAIFLMIFISVFICIVGSYTKVKAVENIEKKVTIVPKINNENQRTFSNGDGFWYPGRTLSKQFVIKNGYSDPIELCKISVNIKSVNNYMLNQVFNSNEDIYKEFMKKLKVLLKDGDEILFEGTFEEFNNKKSLLKAPIRISNNSEKELTLNMHFQEEAGNIFQDLSCSFNLSMQYILKSGDIIDAKATPLPHTGGVYNCIILLIIGLFFTVTGVLIIVYKKEAS